MAKIENEIQYEWAVKRVEQLLPLVNDETPETDSNYIELVLLSNLVADYSKKMSTKKDLGVFPNLFIQFDIRPSVVIM